MACGGYPPFLSALVRSVKGASEKTALTLRDNRKLYVSVALTCNATRLDILLDNSVRGKLAQILR
jgi:hypothetical protein